MHKTSIYTFTQDSYARFPYSQLNYCSNSAEAHKITIKWGILHVALLVQLIGSSISPVSGVTAARGMWNPQVPLSALHLPALICLSLGGPSVFNSIVPHLGISGYYLISSLISALPPRLPGLPLHHQPHRLREGVLLFCPLVRVGFLWLLQHLLLSRHYPVGSLII